MQCLSKSLLAVLTGTAFLVSCSRPVAYFQPTAREHVASATTADPIVTPEPPVSEAVSLPAGQVVQTATLDKIDALVRNDSKLTADRTIQKRLNRVRTLLATTSAKAALTPATVNAPKKMNLMERMMLKKMNKKISRQLAPANPNQAMAIKGVLALGAVVLIAGLLLVLLTSGTGATIGVIGIIAGLALLLIGLI